VGNGLLEADMKRCWKCKIEKDSGDFHKATRRKDGLASTCKVCAKECQIKYGFSRQKRYREENRKQVAETGRKYRESDKGKASSGRQRIKAVQAVSLLTDSYILHLGSMRHAPRESITPELIESVRLSIRIKRLIKEKQNA
jgi:hypothetical protein